ncbi:hypothetical protein EJ02DRAFT_425367 [Clathrospora elynae]|uniref:Uncharacterized protein n=1 Tax=Clathrospora elynae TaxID=706981 RepID=A0A6A5SGG1_9PLEO|nr:hypothetical protein EJ02DRAFT_425367 [Clathrospora elynae]
MSEFIGSRISLISKSDIRYVGTLVEINSEASTVSLDNVRSFGTEGRKGGNDEYPPSDVVYEQIVFRGSDVKDLRIEEPVKEKAPPAMPQDPAIIGVQQSQQLRQEHSPQDITGRPPLQPPPNFPQHGQFPPGGYPAFGGPGAPGGPYQNRFGPPGGFPGGPGPFPGPPGVFGMPPPFGAPPGWFPPGQGFHQPPGPFSPNMPIGPPGMQHQHQNQNQPPQGSRGPAPPGSQEDTHENAGPVQPKIAEADGAAKPQSKVAVKPSGPTPTPAAAAKKAPPPPVDSKPDVAAALAPPHPQPLQQAAGASRAPSGPRNGRIIPAVPLPSPKVTKTAQLAQQSAPAPVQQQNATQLANAAVAEAMAKLNLQNRGQAPGQQSQAPTSDPFNNLAQKVEGMRDEQTRQYRQRGTGEFRGRGGRGGRGGHPQHAKMEVPTTDFDFESSNAKFNKQDMIKEAIATGSPIGDTPVAPAVDATSANTEDVVIPGASMYDKGSSFFDNISSELKDRAEAAERRGAEFRGHERQKNMETFGQGSVDGYRGGRGRGRGRGRGFGFRGRGAPRSRGGAEFGVQPAA